MTPLEMVHGFMRRSPARSASAIATALQLPLESTYEALVALENRGLATFRAVYRSRSTPECFVWSALTPANEELSA